MWPGLRLLLTCSPCDGQDQISCIYGTGTIRVKDMTCAGGQQNVNFSWRCDKYMGGWTRSALVYIYHRWPIIVMMPTLPSMAVPEVVVTTTSGVTSDDKVGIMITLRFQWWCQICRHWSHRRLSSRQPPVQSWNHNSRVSVAVARLLFDMVPRLIQGPHMSVMASQITNH